MLSSDRLREVVLFSGRVAALATRPASRGKAADSLPGLERVESRPAERWRLLMFAQLITRKLPKTAVNTPKDVDIHRIGHAGYGMFRSETAKTRPRSGEQKGMCRARLVLHPCLWQIRDDIPGGTRTFQGDGAPGEIRTPDLMLRRHSLYPAELRAHFSRIAQFAALSPGLRMRRSSSRPFAAPQARRAAVTALKHFLSSYIPKTESRVDATNRGPGKRSSLAGVGPTGSGDLAKERRGHSNSENALALSPPATLEPPRFGAVW